MDWLDGTGLLGADDPDEVDKAFDRAEPHVGVAVIGLALNHPDADTVLARVNRTPEAEDSALRRQGLVALGHTARSLPAFPGPRRGLPCEELYRQLFNPQFYVLAYGRIYANKGAMTPGVTQETVDGMSLRKIERIIDAIRHERYRFRPVRRVHIPKKQSGKTRPLGLPTWSDKLVGEVVRLLLEAYYEPVFSDRSHGFRPGRGCHTALREVSLTWTGTTWFIEGDIADCFGSLDLRSRSGRWARWSMTSGF
jgi:hypothetical protein